MQYCTGRATPKGIIIKTDLLFIIRLRLSDLGWDLGYQIWADRCQTDLVVLDDLGDEIAWVGDIFNDGHAHAQCQHIGVLLQQVLHNRLR